MTDTRSEFEKSESERVYFFQNALAECMQERDQHAAEIAALRAENEKLKICICGLRHEISCLTDARDRDLKDRGYLRAESSHLRATADAAVANWKHELQENLALRGQLAHHSGRALEQQARAARAEIKLERAEDRLKSAEAVVEAARPAEKAGWLLLGLFRAETVDMDQVSLRRNALHDALSAMSKCLAAHDKQRD